MQQFIELLEQMPAASIMPPTNTIGHIFRHDHKENFISDWLAFLLNPEYTGSDEPLTALLKLASGAEAVDIADVSIFREYTFDNQRRIDFLIETDRYIIGIENKIWSGLQPKQLSDYEEQLSAKARQEGKDLILILLCPRANELSKEKQLHTFKLVVYEDLVEAFKSIRFNLFENLRATILMEDFIVHMEEYIMQDPNKAALNFEMWNFEAKYQSDLCKLKESLKESKEQFSKYIAGRMSAVISSREDRDEWKTTGYSTYFQLYKAGWERAQVHFELLKSNAFAPTELRVVLHTKEGSITKGIGELYALQDAAPQQTYSIDYATQASFEASMDKVFAALEKLVETYTGVIDAQIAKAAVQG